MIWELLIFSFIISIILLTLSQFVYVTLLIDEKLSVTVDFIFLSIIFTRGAQKSKRKKKEKKKKPSSRYISLSSFLERCDVCVDRLTVPYVSYPFLAPILFGVSTGVASCLLSYIEENSRSFSLGGGFPCKSTEGKLQVDITARILLLDFLLLVIKRKKKRKVKSIVGIKNE